MWLATYVTGHVCGSHRGPGGPASPTVEFMNRHRTISLSVAALLSTALLAGCAIGGDPAPAAEPSRTPTAADTAGLRFAFTPGLADAHVEALQEEIASRADSGLAVTIDESVDVQHTRDGEQQIVEAVAEGSVDLALVGARVFSQLGVHELDALVAPMVLTSVAAQEAVWSTDVPERMLDGLDAIGVDGLSVYPGPIRRPIAAGQPLTTAAAFEGVPFFAWDGDVNEATVDALGATNIEVTPEERNAAIEDGSILAFENSLLFMTDKTDWATRAMSLNVDLWPSVSVLIANAEALSSLSDDQRAALLEAVDATSSSAFQRLPDERELIEQACANGFTFGLAKPGELTQIEAALAPVHEQLRTEPGVAGYLDEIASVTRDVETGVPTVPADCDGTPEGSAVEEEPSAAPTGKPTRLDGTYAVTWNAADLAEALGGDANPEAASIAQNNAGTTHLCLDRGRYDLVNRGDSCPGTFAVEGDRVVLTATIHPSEWDCGDGLGATVVDARWELADGKLTLTAWELSPTPDIGWFAKALLGTKPLERVDE